MRCQGGMSNGTFENFVPEAGWGGTAARQRQNMFPPLEIEGASKQICTHKGS